RPGSRYAAWEGLLFVLPRSYARLRGVRGGILGLNSSSIVAFLQVKDLRVSGSGQHIAGENRATHGDEVDRDAVRADRDAAITGIRPVIRVSRFRRVELPGRARAARQRVMDAVDDHVLEDVIVGVEEDLDAVPHHQVVHDRLLADV